MSQNDPEVLRAEIARTRAELSDNVDTLTETANPKNIANRQVTKVKSAARGVREHLMGAPDDPYDSGTLGERAARDRSMRPCLRHPRFGAGRGPPAPSTPSAVPRAGASQGSGQPAGGRADRLRHRLPDLRRDSQQSEGAGRRQPAAGQGRPVERQAQGGGRRVADRLREPAQEAVASIKDTATDAVANVKDQGVTAKDAVQEQGLAAKDNVQGQVQDSTSTVKNTPS